MSDAQPHDEAGRVIPPRFFVAALVIAIGTVLFHIHSYWWSESVTLCDVTLASDEGLVSLNLPLVPIAAKEKPRSNFMIYERGSVDWTCGLATRCSLRKWMSTLDSDAGFMFADFGYWKGSWQSKSRPGSFVVLFVPVWLLGIAAFGIFSALYIRVIRFRLRFVLVAMTVFGGILYLLTLRDVP